MSESFDAIVIGAGQSGPPLAVRCGKEGLKTVVIERQRLGGTCVNNGCIPTKTLIASARAAHVGRTGAVHGLGFDGPLRIDMARVKARKDAVVQQSRDGVRQWLANAPNVSVIDGHARFVGPHRVQVGDRVLEAPRIFVNVGGRAAVPTIPGVGDVPFLNNERIMHLDAVPEHLVVIGGSYIGLEFAQAYRRFGAEVTVVEMGPRLIAREDEDVSAEVKAILESEGVRFRLGATCLALERRGTRIGVGVDCTQGAPVIEGTHVLMATGRVPNTHDLGLDAAGIATDARGHITVDDGLRTNVDGVFAIGDCNGRGAFTHTSWNDYEVLAANLFDGAKRGIGDRIPVYALFVDPPLGRVGLTDAQVRARGRPALAATLAMSRVGRAREMGETQGFMKVAVDAQTKRILGAAVLGVHGDEVVQALLEVMQADQPYTVISEGMHIHPTVTELVPTLLQNLTPMDVD